MDEIERRIAEKRDDLRKALEPMFDEDSGNAAMMMLTALRRAFAGPDQPINRK